MSASIRPSGSSSPGPGPRKFGALTREHLPEANDTFKYQLGIILDGRLMSAPVINSEIRDAGIIELGKDARPEEVEPHRQDPPRSSQGIEVTSPTAAEESRHSRPRPDSRRLGRSRKSRSPAVGSLHPLDRARRRVHNRWCVQDDLACLDRRRAVPARGRRTTPHPSTRRKRDLTASVRTARPANPGDRDPDPQHDPHPAAPGRLPQHPPPRRAGRGLRLPRSPAALASLGRFRRRCGHVALALVRPAGRAGGRAAGRR